MNRYQAICTLLLVLALAITLGLGWVFAQWVAWWMTLPTWGKVSSLGIALVVSFLNYKHAVWQVNRP